MGQSTDAILFYGYTWQNEREEFTDDDYDASEEGKEEFGVEIGSHCSCDYPIPYIYISASQTLASRGTPEAIGPDTVSFADDVLNEWNDRLNAFIAKHGISLEAEDEWNKEPLGPGWFLVSNWC